MCKLDLSFYLNIHAISVRCNKNLTTEDGCLATCSRHLSSRRQKWRAWLFCTIRVNWTPLTTATRQQSTGASDVFEMEDSGTKTKTGKMCKWYHTVKWKDAFVCTTMHRRIVPSSCLRHFSQTHDDGEGTDKQRDIYGNRYETMWCR